MSALLAISTGTTAAAVGRPFWDLAAALEGAAATGFPSLEFVLQAEWTERPPLSPTSADLARVVRPGRAEIRERVLAAVVRTPITGVHANRDLGALWAAGERACALDELAFAVELARASGARWVIVHAWDPNAGVVDVDEVAAFLSAGTPTGSPAPILAVENVPSRDEGRRPEDLLRDILDACPGAGLTLDLNWASLYGNLDRLLAVGRERLLNVHVQGRIEGSRLVPRHGELDLEMAVRRLGREGFPGPYAVELVAPRGSGDFATAHRWLAGILDGRREGSTAGVGR
ncbi:MAG: TIM barrel protein [bacterium]|nr:TIM barrel protein [bacterium]